MKFKRKRSAEEGYVVGLDLATKNTELKEEIRDLKEKQNALLRESLQHQYLRYKMKTESEKILHEQKVLLAGVLEKIEQSLHALRKEEPVSPQRPKEGRNPLKENPKQKSTEHTQ
ncbi:uncharacterized protein NEMAJ01_0237 [Nematocida major]|uniref:uncharacterized protein n=1 Tax=Nematocida major TaxID=1912982 RepID=UPI002007CD4D|nr:uncharacterized protein NEMAJ01_0237 [Nematocida major]KAH9385341.1 hypothetical protein NEMAJ01_0237 [Nematocida major]